MFSKITVFCHGCAALLDKLNKLPIDELERMKNVHFENVHGIKMTRIEALV